MCKLKFTMTNKQNKISITKKENTRAFIVASTATNRFMLTIFENLI